LLFATTAHAVLILGVGFVAPDREPPPASLEVTLARFTSEAPDPDADFIAQTNQQGSGEASERNDTTAPRAPIPDASLPSGAARQSSPSEPLERTADPVLSALRASERLAQSDEAVPELPRPQAGSDAPTSEPGSEVASLLARIDEQTRAYAQIPRVERLTSVSAKAAEDAAYLLAWTERVESVGNRNYPREARERRLYGDLRLLVALRPDGNVAEIRVLQSSGYPVLDNAAIRIVRLSSPFEPFPPALRQKSDLLEIIRTWQFRANRLSAGD
jgi:protein TonB